MPLLMGDFREGLRRVVVDFANDNGHPGYWLGSARTVSVTHWQDVRAILHAECREWKVHRTAFIRCFSPAALVKSKDADAIRERLSAVDRKADLLSRFSWRLMQVPKSFWQQTKTS
jgi:hypothetical protein